MAYSGQKYENSTTFSESKYMRREGEGREIPEHGELVKSLKNLLQRRKLLERCVTKRDGFFGEREGRIFLERLWQGESRAITAVEGIMGELVAQADVLIHKGDARSVVDDEDLVNIHREHELLQTIKSQAEKQDNSGAFPLTQAPIVLGFIEDVVHRKTVRTEDTEIVTEHRESAMIMLPPDEIDEGGDVKNAQEREYNAEIIPRKETFEEMLEELGRTFTRVDGENVPNSWRAEPYSAFLLFGEGEERGKIVFVNDGGGNATYIVHDVGRPSGDLPQFAERTKSELRDLGWEKVTWVVYPGDLVRWREKIMTHVLYSLQGRTEDAEEYGNTKEKSYGTAISISRLLKKEYGIGLDAEKLKKIAAALLGKNDADEWRTITRFSRSFTERLVELCVRLSKPSPEWMQPGGVLKKAKEALAERNLGGLDYESMMRTANAILANTLQTQTDGQVGICEVRNFLGTGTLPSEEIIPNNIFRLQIFFSPALIRALIERIIRETAPRGWKTMNAIDEELRNQGIHIEIERLWQQVQTQREMRGERTDDTGYFRGSGAIRREDKHDPRAQNPDLRLYLSPELAAAVVAHYGAISTKQRI